MRERHYCTWEKIKNDWNQGENYFAKSEIQVNAKVKIRTAGATDRTKETKKEWWLVMDILIGFLPDKLILICALVAFVLPYTVYKVNRKLHQIGDLEWKKEEQRSS